MSKLIKGIKIYKSVYLVIVNPSENTFSAKSEK